MWFYFEDGELQVTETFQYEEEGAQGEGASEPKNTSEANQSSKSGSSWIGPGLLAFISLAFLF